MTYLISFACAILFFICAAFRVLRSKKDKSPNKLATPTGRLAPPTGQLAPPPALPWLPLVGSLPFLSQLHQIHWCFMAKARHYGNVFAFYEGPKYVVVLNGYDAIREALIKHATDFAGRGDAVVDRIVWNPEQRGIVFKPYGDGFKRNRYDTMQVLKSFGYGVHSVMETRIQAEIEHLLAFADSTNGAAFNPIHIIEYTTLNIMMDLMFSERFEFDSPMENYIRKMANDVNDSISVIFQVFPALLYFPYLRRRVEEWREESVAWNAFLQRKVAECMQRRDGNNNFVREYIGSVDDEQFDLDELKFILRDLIIAGSETTATQTCWALILIGNNRDVQARVQAEIDSVVPRDRPPSLDDRASLPYTDAVLLELLRMRSVTPFTARVTMCDTQVAGYSLLADTGVLVNLWSAHMDPDVWKDPDQFRPERFLDEHGKVFNRDLVIAFALGKRACLGKALARQELFLFFTGLLQKFDILPPEGEALIKDEVTMTNILRPVPFELRLVKRSIST